MNKEIAKLIKDHGESIFPYLKLRSAFTLGTDLEGIISDQDAEDLEVSGFITTNPITLFEGQNWLYTPPEAKIKVKKEPWIKREVVELAEIVGYPDDWHKDKKYLTIYMKIIKSTPHNKLLQIANYLQKEQVEGATLGRLLTERWIKKYTRDMQDLESLNLTQDRTFDEFEGF